jgi:hypothetical protein
MKSSLLIYPYTGVIDRAMPSGAMRYRIGTLTKNGYLVVWHNNKLTPAHRLIWEKVNGPVPRGLDIDHINGVRTDNRIENLRLVTRSQNNQNVRRARIDNRTSGVKGVSLHKQSGKWRARITVNGQRFHLGNFDTVDQAANAYAQAASTYHTHNPHASKRKPRGLVNPGVPFRRLP